MRIFIIRHGEPDYAKDSLTEKGFIEAELLGKKLENEGITSIYCSPLGRAKRTAEPTVKRTGIEPVIFDWLQEFPYPANNPETSADVCPWTFDASIWTSYDECYNSESFLDIELYNKGKIPEKIKEVKDSFDALLSQKGFDKNGHLYNTNENLKEETLAFFCHHGLGMILLSHLTGCPLPVMWHAFHLNTSSVSEVVMEKHRENAFARCISLSDTSHLYKENEPVSKSGLKSLI